MSGVGRKRSPNWLASEKYIMLLELVEKHFHIIENKKTDGVTMKQKLAEWQIISEQYNSQMETCSRNAENLKNQWESMKKSAKKEESLNRMHRIQTGGGPEIEKKCDPFHKRIISLIKTSAVGLFNPFDGDVLATDSQEQNEIVVAEVIIPMDQTSEESPCVKVQKKEIDDIKNIADAPKEVVIQDWSDYTPELLKTPLSKPLQQEGKHKTWISRRRPECTSQKQSLEKLHEKKIEAIDFQKNVAEGEIIRSNEAHELDLQIKREKLKQEKLKTRILLIDLKLKRKEFEKSEN